ncbi:hypothetical protein J3Q64DRAFT_1748177 [Phycomyces blakesleeanus]|uniref:Uncharacterized protein n=2 Tax=Phycomyces blakesleeanus TaxID=4837 RepID=A0A162UAT3_PHYB8|nr:hypothetical protein PHYBLDRAFT_64668 [Phycomyces blakesleeanus NRRL 1555(-)]OAD73713.1 hypothetical protein PHYBLDRAFT_64668 [Phycomyces blakesleeanus NRRL 1555(-)]|eukprot:XP_018291753.1 hypothetical protein PHYBLDRAFT_64668 [Phycomyces blakesleeanus NRRL 1555(-)]
MHNINLNMNMNMDLSMGLSMGLKNPTKKRVTFSPFETIEYTYSAAEYDRSRFAVYPPTTISSFRPPVPVPALSILSSMQSTQPITPAKRPCVAPLNLSMIPNGSRRSLTANLDLPPLAKKITQKPKLFVDTKSISTNGPLFFTKLSTHYKSLSAYPDDDDEDNNYIPLTAVQQSAMLVIG